VRRRVLLLTPATLTGVMGRPITASASLTRQKMTGALVSKSLPIMTTLIAAIKQILVDNFMVVSLLL
jgi:hypothetical protein